MRVAVIRVQAGYSVCVGIGCALRRWHLACMCMRACACAWGRFPRSSHVSAMVRARLMCLRARVSALLLHVTYRAVLCAACGEHASEWRRGVDVRQRYDIHNCVGLVFLISDFLYSKIIFRAVVFSLPRVAGFEL